MDDTLPTGLARRRFLAALASVGSLGLGGCVTTGLSLETENVDSSPVFETVSLSETWTANSAVASVALHRDAVLERSVAELSVIAADGESVWAGTLDPGQTSVGQVQLPVNTSATVYAVNASGAVVDGVDVAVRGSRLP
jgi:hypothetical protein